MRKQFFAGVASVSLAFLAGTVAHAQTYPSAVTALNPVGYWPLNETTQPTPILDITAHNMGTLGAAGNGYYGAWYQASGGTWYLTNNIIQSNAVTFAQDGSKGLWCQGTAPGQYVIVPRNTNGVNNAGVTLNPPFSIEVWLNEGRQGPTNVLGPIVCQGGTANLNVGGPNTNYPYYGGLGTAWAGVQLGQYQDYLFFMCNATNGTSKSHELDTSAYNAGVGFKIGQVLHVVATFDGTTEAIWTNGVLCVSKNVGANAAGLTYVADPTSPIMIGGGPVVSSSGGGTVGWAGGLADVAIYPSVLSQTSIQNHFQAAYGTNELFSSYTNAVLADNPSLYYRLNDGAGVASATYASAPVASNLGTIGASGNGVYQPGTTPGLAGPPYSGFGNSSKSVGINGFLGGVDVGGGNLPSSLNPTGRASLTVVSWFKTEPADSPARFQEMVGHGDNSYRLALGQTGGDNHFNPGPGPELQFASPADVATNGFAFNDGNWHMAAGVYDGTNEYLYLDGVLAKSAVNTTNGPIIGSTTDLLLGGDSQYTYADAVNANTLRNFDGQIAHVAFWTNALSAAQIQGLYGAAGVPPSITVQPPTSQTNNAGTTVSVSVVARGSAPLVYQWYKGSAKLTSQTSSSLQFSPIALSDAGSYSVVITNSAGSVTSVVDVISVVGPPVITAQSPTDEKVFVGTSPVLRMAVTGPTPISYQWSKDGAAISGATTSSYSPSTASAGTHTYSCTATNSFGPATLNTITLAVLAAPSAPYPARVLADHPINYFRLDEASGGTAYDYAGGLNSTYTNAALGDPGYTSASTPNTDSSETAAGFGSGGTVLADSFAGFTPNFLNFATPSGSSAAFSIEGWYNSGGNEPVSDGGIVAIGYGYGGEQFALDCGAHVGGDRTLRFYVNDAGGATHGVSSTDGSLLASAAWHHFVAVCDEPNAKVSLWVDGQLSGSVGIGATAGIKAWTAPFSIGARLPSGTDTSYTNQFFGDIDDVSVYNVALTSNQIVAHYVAAGIAPKIIHQPPTAITANEGTTVQMSVTAIGTTPLAYQWVDPSSTPIAGATTSTLTLNNVQQTQSGNYSVSIMNSWGTTPSDPCALTVVAGPPIMSTDISPLYFIDYSGKSFSYTAEVDGSAPITYQWKLNGANIPGATTNTYSFTTLAGTNYYQLAATNAHGFALSSVATNIGIAAPTLNPTDYTYRMKVTFTGYNKSEKLANFPALVRMGTNLPGFSFSQLASPTGGDLRFTDASGTQQIPHEIDEWNNNGLSQVWVQVPSLSSSNDYVWAYWGNASATTPLAWSTNGEVWAPRFGSPASYQIVYHLKEPGFPYADSTTVNTSTNGVAPTQTTGIVGNGEHFNGSAWLDANTNDVDDAFTLSSWVNMDPSAVNIQMLWANQHGGYGAPGFALFVNTYGSGADQKIDFASGNGAGGGNESTTAAGTVAFGSWHQIEIAVNRTNGTAEFYYDGSDIFSSVAVVPTLNSVNDINLGQFLDGAFKIHGSLDEARIQHGTASANWVFADYNTVANNATFQTYGPISSTAVTLGIQRIPGAIVLTWPQGTLQAAPTVNGTYSDLSTATSPYTNAITGTEQFFRVRVH